jgi:hypothetical protein
MRKTEQFSLRAGKENLRGVANDQRMILRVVQLGLGRESSMKRVFGLLMMLVVVVPSLLAQEHYTEGPVWRVQLIRVKPTKIDAYLTSLRQSTKPVIEEQKKQGMITITRYS